jgi:hypothetical protein
MTNGKIIIGRLMKYFKQCKLKKDKTTTTSWIPEKYAKVGKSLELKNDDIWENGWVVAEVFTKRKSEEAVIRDADAFKKMRTMTDV